MYFFVKTEVSEDRVDEFTRKLANNQISGVQGNVSYVSPDGRYGYDFIECQDEGDCRQKYSHLEPHGLRILEIRPVQTMGQFIQSWKQRRPAA